VLSICQSLPGLNASNTAILVGDRLHSELRVFVQRNIDRLARGIDDRILHTLLLSQNPQIGELIFNLLAGSEDGLAVGRHRLIVGGLPPATWGAMEPAVDERFDGRLRYLLHLISNSDRKELRASHP
jgi:hypothetical protein